MCPRVAQAVRIKTDKDRAPTSRLVLYSQSNYMSGCSSEVEHHLPKMKVAHTRKVSSAPKGIKMEGFRCGNENCAVIYIADVFEGFECLYCKTGIIKMTQEDYAEHLASEMAWATEYPTVSC